MILTGLPLELLLVERTQVKDLSPLRGMKLKKLAVFGSKVDDLSVIEGMPLEEMTFNPLSDEDQKRVRAIPTMRRINEKPAADYWKETQK